MENGDEVRNVIAVVKVVIKESRDYSEFLFLQAQDDSLGVQTLLLFLENRHGLSHSSVCIPSTSHPTFRSRP
jgi:hypothetical protein